MQWVFTNRRRDGPGGCDGVSMATCRDLKHGYENKAKTQLLFVLSTPSSQPFFLSFFIFKNNFVSKLTDGIFLLGDSFILSCADHTSSAAVCVGVCIKHHANSCGAG